MTRRRLSTFLLIALALLLGTIALDALLPAVRLPAVLLPDLLQNYVTVFLGIFIEAAPFLLLGSLASGLIAEFVTADDIARFFPRNKFAGAVAGALLGMIFPVCECGVVPVVRRLYQKGFPISAGIAFLLGAPVLNPIVIASTYAAFGFGPIFWGRIAFTLLIATGVGLVFSVQSNLARVIAPRTLAPVMGGMDDWQMPHHSSPAPGSPFASRQPSGSLTLRLQNAFTIATDEFFDMGRFLIVGTLIATTLQTFVSQQALIGIGRGPVTSVIALQLLAFVLSVCSTVDAFLALSFVNTFTVGSIIAFLVFGPMVDIKSTTLYLNVFRPRVVFYIIALCFLSALLVGVFINLNVAW
ncbi:MAG: permease [Anaerolineae bacterium]|nr:permease [Candidatus Roseilinea sp.]MDW8450438.1 permease [Anaerolineae bacterium]